MNMWYTSCLLVIHTTLSHGYVGLPIETKITTIRPDHYGIYFDGESSEDGLYTISSPPPIESETKDLFQDENAKVNMESQVQLLEDVDIEDDRHRRYRRKTNAVNVFTRDGESIVYHKINYENLPHSPPSEWLREVVRFHNVLRKLHGSEKLVLDYEASYEAQLWAIELGNRSLEAGKISLENGNSNNQEMGENIGARKGGFRSDLLNLPGSFPVRAWYTEIANHNWSSNYWQWNSGHFTQVIWGATRRIGCGRVVTEEVCEEGKVTRPPFYIVVCRYLPSGNWLHKQAYIDHVRQPMGTKPNQVPDFRKFCPEKSKPCSRPMLCCPERDEGNDSTLTDCEARTDMTRMAKRGRSFQGSVIKTDSEAYRHLGRGMGSVVDLERGLAWPAWHDKPGRHVRH